MDHGFLRLRPVPPKRNPKVNPHAHSTRSTRPSRAISRCPRRFRRLLLSPLPFASRWLFSRPLLPHSPHCTLLVPLRLVLFPTAPARILPSPPPSSLFPPLPRAGLRPRHPSAPALAPRRRFVPMYHPSSRRAQQDKGEGIRGQEAPAPAIADAEDDGGTGGRRGVEPGPFMSFVSFSHIPSSPSAAFAPASLAPRPCARVLCVVALAGYTCARPRRDARSAGRRGRRGQRREERGEEGEEQGGRGARSGAGPEERRGAQAAHRGAQEARCGAQEARRGAQEARRGAREAHRCTREARRVAQEARRCAQLACRCAQLARRGACWAPVGRSLPTACFAFLFSFLALFTLFLCRSVRRAFSA